MPIKLIPESDYLEFARIGCDAYPGMGLTTAEDRKKLVKHMKARFKGKRVHPWGYYRRGKLLGGMWLYDYMMTLRGAKLLTGGVGFIAVDLAHKKEHVAKELIEFYFRLYRDKKKAAMGVLWPFRPDFYRKMGCGYGTKADLYSIEPKNLPRSDNKNYVRQLGKEDLPAVLDCYNRHAASINGMIEDTLASRRSRYGLRESWRWYGYGKGGRLSGFVIFSFEKANKENFVDNHINIEELVYESPEALAGLMEFLRTQNDQISRINLITCDDQFHHFLSDPRNETRRLIRPVYHESHRSGVGVMYRVLDVRRLFELLADHNFGGETCRLSMKLTDTFLPENGGSYLIEFDGGCATVKKTARGKSDAAIEMDISDFSSLIMGAVNFRSLHNYSRVVISNSRWLERVNRLFVTDHKPVCTTDF